MATTPVSPKVKAAGAVGSLVGLLVAYAASVTPETFAFLGKWAQPAYLLVALGSAVYAAYRTADPLRDAGSAAVQIDGSLPEPPAPSVGDAAAPASTYPAAAVAAAEVTAPEVTAPEVAPAVTPAQ